MTNTAKALTDDEPIETLLEDARRRIEVTDDELAEAKRRRQAIASVLRREFPGSRTYANGSVAHGDALTPLEDVDLGVVVPDPTHIYGPEGRGPRELQDRAADAIRRELRDAYGDLRVEVEGRKRSILVRFRDPVRRGWKDFTADVIVAVDNPSSPGLYIPRYATWDRSHPELHTRLVIDAIHSTDVAYARVVRLLKHWARQFDKAPLCSWHIKALALGCLDEPTSLLQGLSTWFRHAAEQLDAGDTADPAHVGPVIKTPKPRREVVQQLKAATEQLELAIELENDGWPVLAHEELAHLFGDEKMLPRPSRQAVATQEAARLTARSAKDRLRAMRPVSVAVANTRPQTRSWAP